MKYNSSLRHNLKKITEDQLPPDSWFKEYMQDVRNGEGWVDLDKVILDISDTLNLDLYGKAGEVAKAIHRLGYGKYLRESAKAKMLREDVWNDYYMKIADVDFNPKTGESKYATRKELEAALKKAYGWDVNKPAIREAIDRYCETDMEESAVRKVKGKKITESKKTNAHELEFENFPAGLRLVEYSDSIGVNSYSGGNGYGSSYNQNWVNPDYPNMEWNEIKKIIENIIRDLVPAADKFDREIERVMNKYGFKKK